MTHILEFYFLKRTIAVLAIGAVLSIACQSSNADVVLGSFENDLASPYAGVDWEINGGVNNSSYVATGATEGSSAIQVEKAGGWGDILLLNGGTAMAADVENHDTLMFDVSVPAGANGDGGDWLQVFSVMQGDGFSWTIINANAGVPTDGSVVTLTADLSAVTLTSASTWAQLIFINQGGDSDASDIEMTIDNIRFVNAVPEPSSLGLIGALAGLLAFRRKR